MDRRSFLVGSGAVLSATLAGCASGTDGSGNGEGDQFPDRVELDVTASIDADHELDANVELENQVITRLLPMESLWLTIANGEGEPIAAGDGAALFPEEFALESDSRGSIIRLTRVDEPIETIEPGEAASVEYTYALNSFRVGALFEATEPIDYTFDGTAAEGTVTIVYDSEIILPDEYD